MLIAFSVSLAVIVWQYSTGLAKKTTPSAVVDKDLYCGQTTISVESVCSSENKIKLVIKNRGNYETEDVVFRKFEQGSSSATLIYLRDNILPNAVKEFFIEGENIQILEIVPAINISNNYFMCGKESKITLTDNDVLKNIPEC